MEKDSLAQFFDWAIKASWDGKNLDGGEVQEKALELGLIQCVPYSYDSHGPRGRHDFGLDDGDNWYIKAP
jgi:hypothetical protein